MVTTDPTLSYGTLAHFGAISPAQLVYAAAGFFDSLPYFTFLYYHTCSNEPTIIFLQ